MKTQKQIEDYLKKNWLTKSNDELAKHIGKGTTTLRNIARAMGLPAKQGHPKKVEHSKVSTEDLQQKRKASVDANDTKKHLNTVLKENDELKKLLSIKEEVPNFSNVKITVSKTGGNTEATAVVLASDWHLEQRVDPDKIMYPNEYNLEIAEKRAKQFFQGTLVLLREAEQNVKIKNLVLWLGGDFITGNIHTENLKICQLGPSQAISFARDLLISGIEFLLKETDVIITIPYNHGNHARITDKVWKSSEEDNSLENILYDAIAYHFKNERRIIMVAPKGSVATVEIYGLKIGFVHGHHGFRYLDGVGGLYIPARKYIMRKFAKANYYLVCMGHHHQYLQDTMFLCNGSMIGYDQYADSCGFGYDIPKQTFFLIEEKRKCRTVTRPILFDN
jgi:hypothetical protein